MIRYVSERNIPLLFQGLPVKESVLTVENYLKWYRLYLVLPSGNVEPVPFDLMEVMVRKDPTINTDESAPYCDHVPNPIWVARYCELLNFRLHSRSLEVMVGRWTLEVKDSFMQIGCMTIDM